MRYLYITLIKAHTGLGGVAGRLTGYPYTHIAVSFDPSLTDFVSFSRRYHHFPFNAGFTHEYRDYYAFGEHKSFRAKVFRLPVSEKAYGKILAFVEERESGGYLFNVYSMATMTLLGGFPIVGAENCMSFTAQVIGLSGCVRLKKPYYRYSIKDMNELLAGFELFEGRIRKRPSDCHPDYMKPFSLGRYFRDMAALLLPLTKRLILKRK